MEAQLEDTGCNTKVFSSNLRRYIESMEAQLEDTGCNTKVSPSNLRRYIESMEAQLEDESQWWTWEESFAYEPELDENKANQDNNKEENKEEKHNNKEENIDGNQMIEDNKDEELKDNVDDKPELEENKDAMQGSVTLHVEDTKDDTPGATIRK
jgi:hypothetical protein